MRSHEDDISFTPVEGYLAALVCLGIPGNIIVCYFFRFKAKHSTTCEFVVLLALFDLIACCVVLPMEIVYLRFYLHFENQLLCQSATFFAHFVAKGSATTLCVISIDRFRHVCYPLERQLHLKGARILCVIVVMLAVLFALPVGFSYHIMEVELVGVMHQNTTTFKGTDCTAKRHGMTMWLRTGLDIILVVCAAVLIGGMYCAIATVVCKAPKNHHDEAYYRRQRMYSLNMVVITLLFYFSYVPYISLMLWRTTLPTGTHEFEHLEKRYFLAFQFGLRSWALNSVLNPVAYGCFFRDFRGFLKDGLCKWCVKPENRYAASAYEDHSKMERLQQREEDRI